MPWFLSVCNKWGCAPKSQTKITVLSSACKYIAAVFSKLECIHRAWVRWGDSWQVTQPSLTVPLQLVLVAMGTLASGSQASSPSQRPEHIPACCPLGGFPAPLHGRGHDLHQGIHTAKQAQATKQTDTFPLPHSLESFLWGHYGKEVTSPGLLCHPIVSGDWRTPLVR